MADETVTQHRELAAFHIFEMGREANPDLPEWDSDAGGTFRTACRYLVAAAHRRTILSCILVAVETIAAKLAEADGETWPDCNRTVDRTLPETHQRAFTAMRRQRYRHLARVAHSSVMNYYELGTDDEAYRAMVLTESRIQVQADKQIVAEMRSHVGVPQPVTTIHKESTE